MCAIPALMLAGTAVQSMGQAKKGEEDAQVAQNNAVLAGYQARDATQQGAYQAVDVMAEGRRTVGAARAAVAGNGIDSTTGSATNLFTASMINAGADADKVKAAAARTAWGYTNQAQDLVAQSKMAKQAGYLSALGTGFGGLGSAASSYAESRKAPTGT